MFGVEYRRMIGLMFLMEWYFTDYGVMDVVEAVPTLERGWEELSFLEVARTRTRDDDTSNWG